MIVSVIAKYLELLCSVRMIAWNGTKRPQDVEIAYALMYVICMKMPKVQSATELRSHLYETLDEVARGEPQIITHKRGESVILISQEKFNALIDEREVLREISIGVSQLDRGEGIPHAIVKERMLKKIDSWK